MMEPGALESPEAGEYLQTLYVVLCAVMSCRWLIDTDGQKVLILMAKIKVRELGLPTLHAKRIDTDVRINQPSGIDANI